MSLRISNREDLEALFDRSKANNIAPQEKQHAKATKRQNVLKGTNSRYHVIVLRIFVAVLAYTLLAAGWLIGAVGDAIWEIGKRMHDSKWNIS